MRHMVTDFFVITRAYTASGSAPAEIVALDLGLVKPEENASSKIAKLWNNLPPHFMLAPLTSSNNYYKKILIDHLRQ